jgi:stringent starvation protein B
VSSPPAPPSKKDVMLTLLERAEARVHLDARRPGVLLPAHLRGQSHLRLDYGYGFTPPIHDLVIDDEGIHATLSFSRQPFATFVPWSAVFLIADFEGQGAVWQSDLPPDLQAAAEPQASPAPALASTTSAPPTAAAPAKAAEAPGKKPRPSHLKLVK